MIRLGKYNDLVAFRMTPQGLYLVDEDEEEDEEILLPTKYIPEGIKHGDRITVFVYLDNEERFVATTLKPKATRHEYAYLRVKSNSKYGSFLDWGISKDLFVPFREQLQPMEEGEAYVVYIYLDEETDRLVATSKLRGFINREKPELETGQEVDILVWSKTEMGLKCIINNEYEGLLYANELFENLKIGSKKKAYVKRIRADFKIDLTMNKIGIQQMESSAQAILNLLERNNGFTRISDKSAPEVIYAALGMSKKNFKRAAGTLYKNRLIEIKPDGLYLINKEND